MKKATYQSLKHSIDQYICSVGAAMRSSSWVNDIMPSGDYLSGNVASYRLIGEEEISSLYVPFVQKVIVPPGSQVVFIGDIHGDYQALEAMLDCFIKQGWCDQNYRLIRDDIYIVCLGDYVNRHPHSLEVIQFLCNFAVDNPGRLFLVRGNHEYVLANRYFKIRFEAAKAEGKDYPAQTTVLDELAEKCAPYEYPDLLYWYDYLPLAVYIGAHDDSGTISMIQASHAGFEVGWSAKKLFAGNATYEYIATIDRNVTLDLLQCDQQYSAVNERLSWLINNLYEDDYGQFAQLYDHPLPINCLETQSAFHLRLGWSWNLFLAENNDAPLVAASGERRSLFLGRTLTEFMHDFNSTAQVQLISTIRGHQHSDELITEQGVASNYLTEIRERQGMVRQWDGVVYTLGATASVSHCHSFMSVLMSGAPGQWQATHWHKSVEEKEFITVICPFVG